MFNANVLSPMLYQAMENAHLGEIRISNEGMALQWGGISYHNGRRQRSILFWGETYRACCLFCNDTRFRLSINHQYGQPDPLNNNWPMTHLVRCFNEDCSKDPNNRRALADRILGFRNKNAAPWEVRQATVAAETTGGLVPPGNCLFLRDLPLSDPAVQYLVVERRLSPAILHKYRLGLCIEPNRQLKVGGLLQNRIIVPIYFRERFVGWQARYVGTPADKDTPKYLTMSGMKKSEVLYNFDRAVNQPYVVVVEGVTDVWAVGDCAVAAFGKTLNAQQHALLGEHWRGQPVMLLLDGDADESREKQLAILQRSGNHSAVVAIQLPTGRDPGNYDSDTINRIILAQALQQGVSIPAIS